jgi:phosphotransferase system HPr (HPr) family protein
MQIMMLAATAGTELIIAANGNDADAAVQELAALVKAGFDEA